MNAVPALAAASRCYDIAFYRETGIYFTSYFPQFETHIEFNDEVADKSGIL